MDDGKRLYAALNNRKVAIVGAGCILDTSVGVNGVEHRLEERLSKDEIKTQSKRSQDERVA